MYIAFKWLVSLAFAMWLAMISKDVLLNKIKKANSPDKGIQLDFTFKNVSEPQAIIMSAADGKISYNKELTVTTLPITIFIAGALAVSLLNMKNNFITFTRIKLAKISIRNSIKMCAEKSGNFKTPAIKFGAAVSRFSTVWKNFKLFIWKTFTNLRTNTLRATKSFTYNAMLNKLREIMNERKNLGKLLISAIQENKNIRMQHQLETLAKNKLVEHIENTRKQIKENKSKYVSFQHLYLITHQENIFLKGRIGKLTKEKDTVEKSLMGLISEIYKTKNTELKAHCSRYIVKTKKNLLNCDVNKEIQNFLKKIHNSSFTTKPQDCEISECDMNGIKSWPVCSSVSRMTGEDNIVSLISNAPKLKGLPGEYVWTVKDKDGIIEKLYEYDYESDFDSGDTIRRIRQYSVYYDKDCLLDFTNSITEQETMEDRRHFMSVENPLSSLRIVSDSEAFKNFLRSHKGLTSVSNSQ